MGSVLHDSCRVDNLTAHLSGGFVHDGQACAEGIGAVDDTGVDAGLADLRGDFLDVGAVGDDTSCGQSVLVEVVVSKDLLGVLADRNIAVSHAEEDILGFQMLGQSVKTVDALVAALGNAENDLVFQQVHAAVAVHEVEAVGVDIAGCGDIQLVHLLLTGRDEQVAVCALLDLGLEGSGGIEVEAKGHFRMLGGVGLRNGVQGFSQGCSCKDDQLDALACACGSCFGACRRRRGACGAAETAAGSQRGSTGHTDGQHEVTAGNQICFHCFFSCLHYFLYFLHGTKRCRPPQKLIFAHTRRPARPQCGRHVPDWAGCIPDSPGQLSGCPAD